jgi:hypothetical protein
MLSDSAPTGSSRADELASLTDTEVAALASAASWYANYHARIIAEQADDESAYAVAQRERYEDLVSGLQKLGARVAPLGERQAA